MHCLAIFFKFFWTEAITGSLEVMPCRGSSWAGCHIKSQAKLAAVLSVQLRPNCPFCCAPLGCMHISIWHRPNVIGETQKWSSFFKKIRLDMQEKRRDLSNNSNFLFSQPVKTVRCISDNGSLNGCQHLWTGQYVIAPRLTRVLWETYDSIFHSAAVSKEKLD